MTTKTQGYTASVPAPVASPETSLRHYDRSSMPDDFLVMIAGQTEEDYYRHAPENRFCEFFDGIVYMPSPVSERHQEIVGFLYDLLNGFRHARGTIGSVLMGPAVLRIDSNRDSEPDLFVMPVDARRRPDDLPTTLKALLVVEVLSPSNRSYDLETKAAYYRAAGVPEIWYVDDREQVLWVDHRVGEESRRERVAYGNWACSSIPGFWIDVSWPRQSASINPRKCLDAILAGPGG